MALPGQNQLVLVVTTFVLLLPGLLGVVVAWEGAGRALWCAAAAAFALTLLGLAFFPSPRDPQPAASLRLLVGLDVSALGLLWALSACADALTRSLRARRFAWFAALLVTAALPLLVAIVLFDVSVLAIAPAHPGQPVNDQLDRLVLELLPIGTAALTVYGVWTALAPWRTRVGLATLTVDDAWTALAPWRLRARALTRRGGPSRQVGPVPVTLGLAVPARPPLRPGPLLGAQPARGLARRRRRLRLGLLVGRDVLDEGADRPG